MSERFFAMHPNSCLRRPLTAVVAVITIFAAILTALLVTPAPANATSAVT